jgi:hypothetical protein
MHPLHPPLSPSYLLPPHPTLPLSGVPISAMLFHLLASYANLHPGQLVSLGIQTEAKLQVVLLVQVWWVEIEIKANAAGVKAELDKIGTFSVGWHCASTAY